MTLSPFRRLEIVLLFTAFIASAYGFGLYLFPAMVESVRVDIPFSYGTLGLISGAVQVGFSVSSLTAGFLTIRFGAIDVILASITLCALALGGLIFAENAVVLAALLLILGGCAAMIWVPMVEVSRDALPARHQGKALGLMSSGTSYGVFINSVLLTILLPIHGWRALWVVTCAIVGALALTSIFRLSGLRRAGAVRGKAAMRKTPERRPHGMDAMPKRLVAAILAMMFLNGFSCMPYQTYLSAYLVGEADLTQETAAFAWGVIGTLGMVSGFLFGALADRITIRRGMILACLILSLACLALIVGTRRSDDPLAIHVAAAAFGMSFYSIFGLVPAYIGRLFGEGKAAVMFGFGSAALGLGGIFGNLLGGFLKEATGSFEGPYLLMGTAAMLSACIARFMPNENLHDTPTIKDASRSVPASGLTP